MALVTPDVALLAADDTVSAIAVEALETDCLSPLRAPFTSSSVESVAVEFAFSVLVLGALLVEFFVVLLFAVVLVSVTSAVCKTAWKMASTCNRVTSWLEVR